LIKIEGKSGENQAKIDRLKADIKAMFSSLDVHLQFVNPCLIDSHFINGVGVRLFGNYLGKSHMSEEILLS
jgi:hypothetical protein